MSVAAVRRRIADAAASVGRDPAGVRLIAVTKSHDADVVADVVLAEGVRDLGENRVQEWRAKAEALPDDVVWHHVGTLQRNKVKYLAAARVPWIHSLDSERLADALEVQGAKHDHVFKALVEVNVAGEAAKQGVAPDALEALLAHAAPLAHVDVVGLMTMAPYATDPEVARPVFRTLAEWADAYALPERSMGMSGDLEVAVQEGATMVRVGAATFAPDDEGGTP